MVTNAYLKNRLAELEKSWKDSTTSSQDHDEDDEEYNRSRDKVVPRTLTAICEALTNAAPTTTLTSDQLREIADGFAQLEHEVVNFAYSNDDDRGGYDFVPVSCGSVTVKDSTMGTGAFTSTISRQID
ncbi:hypothetical protein MPER_03539 [Moniliophthora perniciosa FA553]|nr:hypothetical protein MPER_03539 [Moniliophthora perniciosa FA553]